MPRYFVFIVKTHCNSCVDNMSTLLELFDDFNIEQPPSFTEDLDGNKRLIINVLDNEDVISNETVITTIKNYLEEYAPEYISEQLALNTETQENEQLAADVLKPSSSLFSRITGNPWIKAGIGLLGGGALMALMLTGIGIPFAAMLAMAGISSALTLFIGWDTYYRGFKGLWSTISKSTSLSMDTLFAISTLTAVGISIAAFFVPGMHMMFDAALMILGCQHLGNAIKQSVKKEIIKKSQFTDRAPKKATLIRLDGEPAICKTSQLSVNNIIQINPGDTLPVDGLCLSDGAVIIDEFTHGTSKQVHFSKNQAVLAGMKLADDARPIRIKITKTASESRLARWDWRNLSINNTKKSPIEETATKILRYFIPAVIGLALITGIALSFLFPPLLAVKVGIAILVSACPCTLGIITPLAAKIGIMKSAENKVTFKSHESLQAASEVDTIVFDLNGTLTLGEPSVSSIHITKDSTPANLLSAFSALERNSSHAIAKAIHGHINDKFTLTNDIKLTELKKHPFGISAKYHNQSICIGNEKMMHEHGIDTSIKVKMNDAQHLVYLAYNHQIVGYILLKDQLRHGAKATINELKKMNKEIYICTGADQVTAELYARQLGVDLKYVSAAHIGHSDDPGDASKTRLIASLKVSGKKVAMMGDGVNDSLAMKEADLGIAINSALSDEMTMQNAGASILDSSLKPVIALFESASQTISNIKQNIGISLAYNLLAFSLIATGIIVAGFVFPPAIGAGLMVLQACFVLANAYRFRRQSLPHVKRINKGSSNSKLSSSAALNLKFPKNVSVKKAGANHSPMLSFTGHVPMLVTKRNINMAKEPETVSKGVIPVKAGMTII